MLRVVPDEAGREDLALTIDDIVRAGAQRMLAMALEVEVDAYIEAAKSHRDEGGRAMVVRNGRARPRKVITAAGAMEVRAPRVDDRRTAPRAGTGSGSGVRSCPPTSAAPPR